MLKFSAADKHLILHKEKVQKILKLTEILIWVKKGKPVKKIGKKPEANTTKDVPRSG